MNRMFRNPKKINPEEINEQSKLTLRDHSQDPPNNKKFSDLERVVAVMMLQLPHMTKEIVANEMGVSTETIRRWATEREALKISLEPFLQATLLKLLERIPDKFPGNSWAVAVGIVVDKLLVLQGLPTTRTESTALSIIEKAVPPDQQKEVIDEFNRIIAQTSTVAETPSGGSGQSDGDSSEPVQD